MSYTDVRNFALGASHVLQALAEFSLSWRFQMLPWVAGDKD